MRYRHRAEITFIGVFPVDMLRYDGCFPDTEQDSGMIAVSTVFTSMGNIPVTVAQHSTARVPQWTPARWASFGATITQLPLR